ncbi:MAG: twin transmembrane helix small protein [Rhodocyclaceae bacterium]|nr:twin transmembrane helix small protein [Rhodocyclaceae bacterium]MBX3671064.1 twin transmembrane helix small protein [Rhodocyclaceae bacterium]
MKFVVLAFVAFILISLFSALFFVFKDKGQSKRAVKALTMRVGLSVILFLMLIVAYHFGLISDRL